MNEAVLYRIEANDRTLKVAQVDSTRGLRQFIAAVPNNSNIRTLGINGVVMVPEIATSLSAILPNMPFLGLFLMSACNCSNADGLSILVSALSRIDSLNGLSLFRCRIGSGGAENIASSFDDNSTLRKLSLIGDPTIGNEGAIALASLLSSNSSITDVGLMHNNIGADGLSALAASLCENKSVQMIDLQGNTDEPSTHFNRVIYNDSSIESVIASNHTLKVFRPDYNFIHQLLDLNESGPEQAVRAKIIRFLNEKPTFVITTGIKANLIPSYLKKIGRDCRLNTMFELICNMPALFETE